MVDLKASQIEPADRSGVAVNTGTAAGQQRQCNDGKQ